MLFFIIAGVYIAFITGLSYFLSKNETRDDFLIGRRRLSALPLAISLSTSWLGGGSLVLMLYFVVHDLPGYFFLALGAVTNLIVFSFFIKKPYELAKKHGWITMTEVVNGILGKTSARFVLIFVLLLFSIWFLFELVGSALVLSAITPLSYLHSVVLMALVVCAYLCLGGFKSLIRTDLIQYGLMIFMLLACFYLAKDVPPIDFQTYLTDKPGWSLKGFLAGFFGFFALQFSESTIWQRILAAQSAEHAKKALVYTSGFYLINYGVLIVLLILGLAWAPELQDEKLFAFIAYDALPLWLGSLFLISLLAIMMSTLDTVLFIAAQCFSTDHAHLFDKELQQPRNSVRTSMIVVTVIMAVVALLTQDIEAIFWFVVALWVCLTPICYMFLPVKKPSDMSVFSSMVIMAVGILILYSMGLYQDYYIAYVFFIGLALPLFLDKVIFPTFFTKKDSHE